MDSQLPVVKGMMMKDVEAVEIPRILPEEIREVFSTSTCLYTKAQVEKAFDQLALEISRQLSETNPIFLCVVIGGIIPLGNLLPRLDFPLEVDYVHATRYRNKTRGEDLQWLAKPRCSMKNRTVIIVDDILDGGITLQEIVDYCKTEGAEKVYTAVLADKKEARLKNGLAKADFCGLEIDNHYVFGYGMDYKGYLRNAPGIYRVASEYE